MKFIKYLICVMCIVTVVILLPVIAYYIVNKTQTVQSITSVPNKFLTSGEQTSMSTSYRQTTPCPSGYDLYGSMCYRVINEQKAYHAQRLDCLNDVGPENITTLVRIDRAPGLSAYVSTVVPLAVKQDCMFYATGVYRDAANAAWKISEFVDTAKDPQAVVTGWMPNYPQSFNLVTAVLLPEVRYYSFTDTSRLTCAICMAQPVIV